MTEQERIAELREALREALDLAMELDAAFDQDHRVEGDPPCEDEATIARLREVLERRP